MGGAVSPRSRRMNGVLVPLPEPGAPPSHMISFGNTMFSSPRSCTRRFQMCPKMSGASLISRPEGATRPALASAGAELAAEEGPGADEFTPGPGEDEGGSDM